MKQQIEDMIEEAHDAVTYASEGGYGADFTPQIDLVRELTPKIIALIKAQQKEAASKAWDNSINHRDFSLRRIAEFKEKHLKQYE